MQISGDIVARVLNLRNSWFALCLGFKKQKPELKCRTFWMALDYHLVLHNARFQRTLNSTVVAFASELSRLFQIPIRFRIDWRANGFRLVKFLRT